MLRLGLCRLGLGLGSNAGAQTTVGLGQGLNAGAQTRIGLG